MRIRKTKDELRTLFTKQVSIKVNHVIDPWLQEHKEHVITRKLEQTTQTLSCSCGTELRVELKEVERGMEINAYERHTAVA